MSVNEKLVESVCWSVIPYHWQQCFEEAWKSFQEGSRPIGALIVNTEREIVSRGKSAVFNELSDTVISHNEIAHAEVNALLKIDNRIHKKVNNYVLYSTMEPCPLCFGALYMSGLKNLKYAAKDKYGGSTNLLGTTPYLSRKRIQIEGPIPYLADLSILLSVYFDLELGYEKGIAVIDMMAEDYPEAVGLAFKWVEEKRLGDKQNLTIEKVFEMMIEDLKVHSSF
ncbi:nucleoside deaminase [Fredinandcohnia humi]